MLKESVLVIGCDDVGQGVIAQLTEYGISELSAVDSAAAANGKSKVFLAEAHAKEINPKLKFRAWRTAFTESKASQILKDKAVVINTVTDPACCLLLEEQCAEAGVPLLSCALDGWRFRVLLCMPRSKTYSKYLKHKPSFGKARPNPFTVNAAAAALAAETVKLLQGEPAALADGVLQVDLQHTASDILALEDEALYERTIRVHLTYSTGKADPVIPADTTLNQLIAQYEAESVYAMVNRVFIKDDQFDEPLLKDGDDILLRRNIYLL